MLKIIRITSAVLLVACMVFVFSMSSQTAKESSGTSGRVITAVLKIVYPDFEDLSQTEQAELVSSFQFIARKGAHFSIYAVMGFLAFLTVGTYTVIPFKFRILLSAAICLLFSISDEIHQLFISGRSGEVRDVFLDFCGSILAIALISLFMKHTKIKFLSKHFRGDFFEKKETDRA